MPYPTCVWFQQNKLEASQETVRAREQGITPDPLFDNNELGVGTQWSKAPCPLGFWFSWGKSTDDDASLQPAA
jgi:hypothetical protein